MLESRECIQLLPYIGRIRWMMKCCSAILFWFLPIFMLYMQVQCYTYEGDSWKQFPTFLPNMYVHMNAWSETSFHRVKQLHWQASVELWIFYRHRYYGCTYQVTRELYACRSISVVILYCHVVEKDTEGGKIDCQFPVKNEKIIIHPYLITCINDGSVQLKKSHRPGRFRWTIFILWTSF